MRGALAGLGRFAGLAGLASSDGLARRARDLALAWLPPTIAQLIFRRARGAAALVESRARFGGFDWRRTLAFSEEANTQPGVWINLAGREAEGCVSPADYEATRDRVLAALRAWKLPSGEPVVARALRREAVYTGPFVDRAPDIVLELALDAGHGLSLVPTPWSEGGRDGEGIPSVRTLAPDGHAGGRGRGMNGTHRGEGIFIDCGPAQDPASERDPNGSTLPPRLAAVAPWLAQAMGLAWATEGAEAGAGTGNGHGAGANDRAHVAYDEDEEAMVAERLRALGYLE